MKKCYSLIALLFLTTLTAMAQSGLVINEVDYDQPTIDSAEFIELYNGGSSSVNLGDYTVLLFNGSSTSNSVYDSFPLPAQTLSPGAFFVICSGSGKVPLCNLADPTAITNMIQNAGSGTTTGSPDAIAIRNNQTSAIVDVVSYEGDCIAPYVEGTGLPTTDSDTLVTDSIAGRYLSISRFPDGNDSNNNATDFRRACATPGTANSNTDQNCNAPSSIFSVEAKASLSVYPNPSRGMVNIDLKKINAREVNASVLNILGNEVFRTIVRNQAGTGQMDLTDLQNGVYIVKISAGSTQYTQRLVIRK